MFHTVIPGSPICRPLAQKHLRAGNGGGASPAFSLFPTQSGELNRRPPGHKVASLTLRPPLPACAVMESQSFSMECLFALFDILITLIRSSPAFTGWGSCIFWIRDIQHLWLCLKSCWISSSSSLQDWYQHLEGTSGYIFCFEALRAEQSSSNCQFNGLSLAFQRCHRDYYLPWLLKVKRQKKLINCICCLPLSLFLLLPVCSFLHLGCHIVELWNKLSKKRVWKYCSCHSFH